MTRLENIKNSFKSIQIKTKAFFQGEQWKEAVVFSFFVLLAFGFWLLKSLQQEYEIQLSLPVKYKHVPVNVAFSTPLPETISVRVKDKGSVLLNYSFGRPPIPMEVDLIDVDGKDSTFTVHKKQIENHIQKQLISTTSLQIFEPQQIHLMFSKRVHKEIPVSFNGFIHLEAGFQKSGDIQISPNKIQAYATSEVLSEINEIQTIFTEFDNANKTITKTIHLSEIEGVNYDPTTVTVTIPIEEYTEKTLEIPVTCSDLPAFYTARMFPQRVKVTCRVPLSRFKELTKDMFSIEIPFIEMEQNTSGSIPVRLTQKPDWVGNVTTIPTNVEFILEQNNKHD